MSQEKDILVLKVLSLISNHFTGREGSSRYVTQKIHRLFLWQSSIHQRTCIRTRLWHIEEGIRFSRQAHQASVKATCWKSLCPSCGQSTPLMLCVIMCLRRLLGLLKLAVHWLQVYGFSPEWVLRWIFRLPFCVKRFPHCAQAYGFSPVWMRMWMVSVVLLTNDLPQKEQGMGVSPVWVARCEIRSSRLRKHLPQKLQSRGLLAVWGKIFCCCCWENWLIWLGGAAWLLAPINGVSTGGISAVEGIWVEWFLSSWLFLALPGLLSCSPLSCALSVVPVVKFRRLSWVTLSSEDSRFKAWSSEEEKRVLLISCRGPSPRPWTLTILSSSPLSVRQEDSKIGVPVSSSPCVLRFLMVLWPKKANQKQNFECDTELHHS